ncbi:MAG: hypothetical protein CME61_07430 [Halobacteriovoraceae bacterium]|nr:hypothetical protein [Halobacteriovoraceae bacterium]|tara:strand:- start:1587 stop:2669 length:1083 start_codon:yes stop_codon:yes gene_type:complete
MRTIFSVLFLSAFLAGCGGSGSSSGSSSGITVSGQMALSSSLDSYALSVLSVTDYSVRCVAFDDDATSCSSDISSDGAFSCSGLPANTGFGCFVLNSTNAVAATLEFVDTDTGFDNSTTSSVSLKSSVALGQVTLNPTTGKATVSITAVESATSDATAVITVTDLNNTSWALSCISSGDTLMDAACASFISDSPNVFFRIITAQSGSTTMYGMGVWASQTAFQGCGSIDMTDSMKSGIESEEGSSFSFTSVDTASTFTADHSTSGTCPTYNESTPTEPNDLENYYSLQKLEVTGNLYTLHEDDEFTNGSGCTFREMLSVSFSPQSATVLNGAFSVQMLESGSGCPGEEVTAQFTVKFTKQ